MSEINKVEAIDPQDVRKILKAFHDDPSMQRLRKHFEKAPPPWSKVRDVSQEGP